LGLSAALREYLSQCTKSNNIRIEFKENIKDIKVDERIEITLYRIVQEAICNTIKHAKASLVRIVLLLDKDKLKLTVEDNGRGFDVNRYRQDKSADKLGLRGIKERVDAVRGYFAISSSRKRTKLTIILPQQIKL
jgi:two-component system sensor histidine kinase DegS